MLSNMVLIIMAIMGFVLLPAATEAAPAYLIFGDSLVDVGNNNYLLTGAKADFPPYGIDYPPTHKPTGRYSNGYNMADLIGKRIGAELVLPYLSPNLTGDKLYIGANFASAGVGILNDTGSDFLNILKMWQQLQLFEEYQGRLTNMLGKEGAWQVVNRAFVLISIGSNDFINNYFTSSSPWPGKLSVKEFCTLLVSEYRKILMRLYEMGVRKVMVPDSGPIGCAPRELALRSKKGKCVGRLLRASATYNPMLMEMIKGLNTELGSNIFFCPTKFTFMDLIKKPKKYGFSPTRDACCGGGRYNGADLCSMDTNLCLNRSQYLFWDNFHPTERANRVLVKHMMAELTEFVHPMNLSTTDVATS